jgi:hypothetical protein
MKLILPLIVLGLASLFTGGQCEVVTMCGEMPTKPKRPPPHECQPYAEVCTACKDCSKVGGKCSVCWKK